MGTIAQAVYRESNFGDLCELPRAGSALENPLVYDSTARELQALAAKGMLEVVEAHESLRGSERLIDRFSFRRMR
jgi:hypothetical protein